jgi:hypothetical protein
MTETRSVLYDLEGHEVDDEARAVRGALYEIDDDGNIVRVLERWVREGTGSILPPDWTRIPGEES